MQQPFSLDIPPASRPSSPAMDAPIIRALASISVVYRYTRWNAWYQDWEHIVAYRGRRLAKTDEGIAAMLRQVGPVEQLRLEVVS